MFESKYLTTAAVVMVAGGKVQCPSPPLDENEEQRIDWTPVVKLM